MSAVEPAAGTRVRAFAWVALLPVAIGAVLFVLLAVARDRLLNDPDTYWHIASARWIVEHRSFPSVDPFSFTFPGAPWIAKEWLSQLLYLAAFDLGGWNGVALLAAASAAVAFALLAWLLLDRLAPLPVIAVVAVAFLLTAPHIVARPHLLALPVMVAFVGGLVRAADARRRPSFLLLPLMTLWANLHGGFTLGLVLTAALGVDAVVGSDRADRWRTALGWIAFVLLALVAACITPYGPESILVTKRIFDLGPALALIAEWRPVDFSRLSAFEICLLLGIGLALWRGVRLPGLRIVILLGLIHLALSSQRNLEILALLAPLVLAAPIASSLPGLSGRRVALPSREAALAGGIVGLVVAIVAVVAVGSPESRPASERSPAAALAAIRDAGGGRILNDYDFGGFLIFAGVPTFIDGRGELYGGDFIRRHYRAVTLEDLDGLLKLIDDYDIEATLLDPDRPAVAFLDRLPGWRRVYADDVAVVHRRDLRGALDP